MANSQKPIVAIIGSRSITYLNLNTFITPEHCGQIISGGANGVDTIAEKWAKDNKIEFIKYKPNYRVYKDTAPFVRNREMVEAADIVIAFWDHKSTGTLYTLKYCEQIGRKYICHLVIDM